MRRRMLMALVSAAVGAGVGFPGVAVADPPPPPPPPPLNLNALTAVKPSDFAMQNGEYYAFAVPGDIACAISRRSGNYGCTGPLPAAPDGANAVTGGQQGPPTFLNDNRPLFGFEGLPNRLQPGSRISFRNVTCGTDGTVTMCSNSYDGAGFALTPGSSFILGVNNPLLLNTGEGRNPFAN
ncbi:hypothetical protein BST13_14220 [Mycobacterium aquaticum]|uniref:Secreted protein n=2 Tax=Mycobacterium aquaticum TaxID=1927124 RepID=A0A1X0AYV5_9MYCO|nr:hypothetical protein BST13_14220 [Mycobacterium aquaticum]